LQSGDLLKIGAVKIFVRKQSASRAEELNPALYFPGGNRRESIPTLPLYLGYNTKTKKAEATIDPYDDKNLIKIDLDDKGLYCRNIAGAHDVTINNMEFQQMRLQNGDNITIKQFDVIFELYTGKKTGVENSLGGIRAYDQNRPNRRPLVYGGMALTVIVLLILSYLLYPKLQSNFFVNWQDIGNRVKQEINRQKETINAAFSNTDELFNDSRQMFEPLMQFKTDYTMVRDHYYNARKNKLLNLAASALSPGTLERIDGLFNSMDELYNFENDIDSFHNAHRGFYNSIQSLLEISSRENLQHLRQAALSASQSYNTLDAKLKIIQDVHSKISSMANILHNIADFQIFGSLEEILFNLGQHINSCTHSVESLQDFSAKISQIIPE